MNQYCLVTTSLQAAWDGEHPNLLLGEWARPYDRRYAWSRASLCEPLVENSEERFRQFCQIQALAGKLLGELAAALNEVHGCEHGRRYWNILLGHWLQRFLCILFNRHATLKWGLARYPVSHSRVLDSGGFEFSTRDSGGLVAVANDPRWNHFLFARLLRQTTKVTLVPVSDFVSEDDRDTAAFAKDAALPAVAGLSFIKVGLRTIVRDLLASASAWFTRDTDAFILNSYLPRWQEVLLFAALGQVPQKWRVQMLPEWSEDKMLRARLKAQLEPVGDEFERLARACLPDFLPRCFLEGYRELVAMSARLPWPREPRFIFTSNNFDSDELFKFWTATKVEAGRPYIVGQHGAGYGTHKYLQTCYAPEHSASDCFLTWGWRNENPRNVPAFLLKTAGMKRLRPAADNARQLLIVAPVVPNLITHWDTLQEFARNQEFQFRLVQALPQELRRHTRVRLHHGAAQKNWCDVQRWGDAIPTVPVDIGKVPLENELEQVRLVVFTYDSTGMLEFFALDRPAISVWYGGLDHLLPEAREDYQKLVEVGLIHLDPELAAAWVAKHWGDVRSWWDSATVRQAREGFAHKYARHSKSPVLSLRKLLLGVRPTLGGA